MKHYKIILISLAVLLLGTVSCNEDFLNIQNPNSYTEDSYFTTPEQLEQAIFAAYYGFYHVGLFAREWYFYHDMLGNDAKAAPAIVGTGSMGQLPALTYDGTNTEIQNLWRALYRIVLRSTIALDKSNGFEATTSAEEAVQKNILGESSFLKAWAYFVLYRFWGVVPVRKSIEDMAIKDFPRASSEQEVVDYILELLQTAEENLPVNWDASNAGRATRGAAVGLRGQLFMWENEYANALTEFKKLGSAPYTYDLAEDFANVTAESSENNIESIFEIQQGNNPGTNIWYMFGGQESWGPNAAITGRSMEFGFNDWFNVFVSPSLVQSFVYDIPGGTSNYTDPRAKHTFYGDGTYGGDTDFYCESCEGNVQPYPFEEKGYSYKKYQYYEIREKEGVPQSTLNNRYLRYADVLLQMAECEIQAGNDGAALTLINRVRRRAGAEEYTDLGSDPMATLKLERRLELSGEQVRFWDMVRWGDLVSVLNDEKEAQGEGRPYQEKHRLFPIPTDELDINKEMDNNVYYPNWN